MRIQSIPLAALAALAAAAVLAPAPSASAVPAWGGFSLDAGGAVATGSGCAPGDVQIIASGRDVSILFRRLAVRLFDGSGAPLSGLASCSVRIPAKLRAGRFVSEVEQLIEYGVNKTGGSSGEIAATGGFDGSRPFGLSVTVGEGARRASGLTASGTSPFMTAGACRSSDREGLFRADVAIAGTRRSKSEALSLGAVGQDLRYDMTLSVEACP